MARWRSAILCSFEPVKWARAVGQASGGTTRRSQGMPPVRMTLDLVSPWATTFSTLGAETKTS